MREKRQRWILGFLLLIFAWTSSCGEPIPVDCATEEECTTENEGGFQTGTVAGIAAGGAAVAVLAGGTISGGGESSGGSGGDTNDSAETIPSNGLSTPQEYFTARVSENIIQNKCITCHVSGGLAQSTPLIYTPTSNPVHAETNFSTLQNYIQNEPSRATTMLQKVSGELTHAGGIQLIKNSIEYGYLKSFLEMLVGNVEATLNSRPAFYTDPAEGEVVVGTSSIRIFFSEYVTGFSVDSDRNDLNFGSVYLVKYDGTYVPMTYTVIGNSYTLDPVGELPPGTHNLVVGFGGQIKDVDGLSVVMTIVEFAVADALSTVKLK